MEWFWRIVLGLIIAAMGVSMTFKTGWYLRILGRVGFAEKTFGGGGTRFFYKLLGIAISVIGLLLVTDLLDNLLEWLFLGLFGRPV